MSKITRLIKKFIYPNTYSNEAYLNYLRNDCHITIGEHCKVWSPNETHIDIQRPHMLHIGDYVKITRNVTILCHDYSRSVCCNMSGGGYTNVGEGRVTWIGDNVFIGINATILMGAHIGNNSIVGAGSVVSGSFPEGVVLAGNPAKVICTIDEYYRKRKNDELDSAKLYVKQWREKYGRDPDIYEMTNAFSWLYLPRNQETIKKYNCFFKLSAVNQDTLLDNFFSSTPVYNSFEDFLKDC